MSQSYKLDAAYGKQSVPVFKIRKQGPRHSIMDMEVKIMLEGDISLSWTSGNNSQIVPTETQKNTAYALALKTEFDSIEDYGLALGRDMLHRHKHIHTARLALSERLWERVRVKGTEHNHVFFSSPNPLRRICDIVVRRSGPTDVKSGVAGLKLLKTTQSGFQGYIQDEYTNLQPTGTGTASPDRILSTKMRALWTYKPDSKVKFADLNGRVLNHMLEAFGGPPTTGRFSKSLQITAHRMATAVLDNFSVVESVLIETPNVHFYTYPLEQFGLQNPNLVFQSTDCETTASGRIVTTLSRPTYRARM